MEEIDHAFRSQDYNRARQLISQLPVDQRQWLLDLVAEIVDDGTAMKIIVEANYCPVITRRIRPRLHDSTALHVLVHRGNVHAIREIMKMNVKEQLSQQDQDNCLVMAAQFGQKSIVEALTQGLQISWLGAEQAIRSAIRHRHVDSAEIIFLAYKETLAPLFVELTEQVLRIKINRKELTDFLCRAVAACPSAAHAVSADKLYTPLHAACTFKNEEAPVIVRALIDHGASLDARDHNKQTPLDLAYARHNDACLILMLEKNGAPIFWMSNEKTTGSSLYSRIINGDNIKFFEAMLKGHPELGTSSTLLVASLAMTNRLLFSFLMRSYPNIISAQDFTGRNGLMYAIFSAIDRWYFDMMLRHGKYSFDDVDNFGYNLAHYAASATNSYYAEVLIRCAPHLFLRRGESGQLPVDCAVSAPPHFIRRLLAVSKYTADEASKACIEKAKRMAPPAFRAFLDSRASLTEMLLDASYMQQEVTVRRTY